MLSLTENVIYCALDNVITESSAAKMPANLPT